MKKRKQYTGKEKISILRKHLLEGVSAADVDEYSLQPGTLDDERLYRIRADKGDAKDRSCISTL